MEGTENSDELSDPLWETKQKHENQAKTLSRQEHANCTLTIEFKIRTQSIKTSVSLYKNSLCFTSEALFYQLIESSETEHGKFVVSPTDRLPKFD